MNPKELEIMNRINKIEEYIKDNNYKIDHNQKNINDLTKANDEWLIEQDECREELKALLNIKINESRGFKIGDYVQLLEDFAGIPKFARCKIEKGIYKEDYLDVLPVYYSGNFTTSVPVKLLQKIAGPRD